MKTRLGNLGKEQGAALLVVLISCLILGLTLASFLQYTSTQARSIQFSQSWNSAIPVAEAGVEEALAHINDSTIGTNFAINGWVRQDNQFIRTGTISGMRYFARISTNTWPVLTVTGYTQAGRSTNEYARTIRVTTSRASTGMKGIVVKGDAVMNGNTQVDSFDSEDERYSTRGRYDEDKRKDGGYVASVNGNVTGTTVYGTVGTGPTGTATGNIGTFDWLSGNTGVMPGAYANDVNYSFPVAQAPYDSGGIGVMPLIRFSQIVILTNFAFWSTMITTTNYPSPLPPSGVITNVNGTNILLFPSYPTGVAANQVKTNWTTVVNQKTDPTGDPTMVIMNLVKHQGRYDYDLLTSYSYPAQTYTYSLTATNYSMTTNSYDYVLRTNISTKWIQNGDLSLASEKMLVMGPNTVVYVKGDFRMTGNAEIIIAPGASLKMYVAGNVNLAGNGILNYTLDASKFSLFGLPSCTDIQFGGNAEFTGVVYAPQANISLNGSGTTVQDIVGAIVGARATLNGLFQFHYDEALGRAKILAKYTPASWVEL
jgi:Tfp pilus assembly protein PilX